MIPSDAELERASQELRQMARELGLENRRLQLAIKRLADIVLAVLALLLTWPLIALLALLVRRSSPGPAFFVQERLGRFARPFKMIKLRTMVVGAEKIGPGLAVERDDPRITPIGRFLRRTSLDELPQLWNILRGDMSFVGPRPLFRHYLPQWTKRQRMRLLLPQGLTGWAQINGRNAADWQERLEMDAWYVENWSLWLDARIFLQTIWAMLTGAAPGDQPTDEFKAPGAESQRPRHQPTPDEPYPSSQPPQAGPKCADQEGASAV